MRRSFGFPRRPKVAVAVASIGAFAALASCGARTALDADFDASAPTDAGRDGDATLDADADLDARVGCVPGDFPLTRAYPSVMLVIDRSTSMNTAFGTSTRWVVLKEALAAALPPIDRTIALGALIFPAGGGGACVAPSAPDIDPALSNASAVMAKLLERNPSGSTPTAESLEVAASSLAGLRTATSARALVLATDGAPGCNTTLDPATCTCISGTRCTRAERCLDDKRTVATIARAAAQGIPTYVIGLQDAANATYSDVLDAMAVAGGKPRTGAARKYYAATSRAELDAALVAIRAQVGECTFLTTSVPSADGTIVLTLDGAEIPFDPSGVSGWRWQNQANGEIALTADECTRASRPGVAFKATVACEAPDTGASGAVDASEVDAEADGEADGG